MKNKLHEIQPLVGKQQPKLSSIRDDMVIVRARIENTYLTHKHLMVRESQPVCNTCDHVLSVNHIFIGCRTYQNIRSKYFKEKSMKELFENERFTEIIGSLKEIDFYFKF